MCHLEDSLWTITYGWKVVSFWIPAFETVFAFIAKRSETILSKLGSFISAFCTLQNFKFLTENFITNLENSKMEGTLLEKYRKHLLFVKSSGSFFAITFLGDDHLSTDDFKVSARVNHGSVWSDFWVLGKVALGIKRNCDFDILKGTFHFH